METVTHMKWSCPETYDHGTDLGKTNQFDKAHPISWTCAWFFGKALRTCVGQPFTVTIMLGPARGCHQASQFWVSDHLAECRSSYLDSYSWVELLIEMESTPTMRTVKWCNQNIWSTSRPNFCSCRLPHLFFGLGAALLVCFPQSSPEFVPGSTVFPLIKSPYPLSHWPLLSSHLCRLQHLLSALNTRGVNQSPLEGKQPIGGKTAPWRSKPQFPAGTRSTRVQGFKANQQKLVGQALSCLMTVSCILAPLALSIALSPSFVHYSLLVAGQCRMRL